jgi:transposase
MNSQQLFCAALGLSSPWSVTKVEFTENIKTSSHKLHIHVDFARGAKFVNSQGRECGVHDTEERQWQHLNFFEHACFLHARVPRLKNPETGKMEVVALPWARPGSGFSLLFEAFVMSLIENEMAVSRIAHLLGINAHRIWRVFNHYIGKAIAADDLSQVRQIGVDETSVRKGHRYITVVMDLEQRRTIHVVEGKDGATLEDFKAVLKLKGGDPGQIHWASIDMSPAFISGLSTHFPQARIVFDRFHLMLAMNKAIDITRKKERRGNDLLKGHKYTVLRRQEDLSDAKQQDLHILLEAFPQLAEVYRHRETLNEVWAMEDSAQAQAYLEAWCESALATGIAELAKVVKTYKAHWSGIMAYFENRINNSLLENTNLKIQAAKRRARGYRNIQNFINMVYFLTAKLQFNYPRYPA